MSSFHVHQWRRVRVEVFEAPFPIPLTDGGHLGLGHRTVNCDSQPRPERAEKNLMGMLHFQWRKRFVCVLDHPCKFGCFLGG